MSQFMCGAEAMTENVVGSIRRQHSSLPTVSVWNPDPHEAGVEQSATGLSPTYGAGRLRQPHLGVSGLDWSLNVTGDGMASPLVEGHVESSGRYAPAHHGQRHSGSPE